MNKCGKAIYVLLLSLIIASCFFSVFPAAASTVTMTVTFLSPSTDGYIYVTSADRGYTNYYDVQSALTGYVDSDEVSMIGGQRAVDAGFSVIYDVYRMFPVFNTISIPIGANITSAILGLYIETDSSTTDFNVTIQSGVSTVFPHQPLESGDYYDGYYTGVGGTRNTNEITGAGYWNISLTTAGLAMIQKGGTTKLCLRSSNDINQVVPTGDEYVSVATREYGIDYSEKLYVTFTTTTGGGGVSPAPSSGVGGTVTYLIHGPYYENGSVAPTNVSMTLYQPYDVILTHNLDATNGTADLWNVSIAQPAIYMAWNVSTGYNYTRLFYFNQNSDFEEIWIYIPEPTQAYYYYQFDISSFTGVSNPYFSAILNDNGYLRTMERRKIETGNVGFILQQWHSYTITFTCDQGTYTQSFSAENPNTVTPFIIPGGAFTTPSPTGVTVYASRLNSTTLYVKFSDSANATTWFYYNIYHFVNGVQTNDYAINLTVPGYLQLIGWNLNTSYNYLDSKLGYYVDTQYYRGTGIQQQSFPINELPGANPWTGAFDFLGSWEINGVVIDPGQLIAMVIILLFLCIGSIYSVEVSCILSIIAGGIMWAIGWWAPSVPLFGLAAVTAALIALERGKMGVREV